MVKIQRTKSIREQVYEELKKLIVDGEILSGEKIVELDYAEKFGVSRTPIREALRMLEYEGLVSMTDRGGVIVNYISEDDIKEIYKVRIVLEDLVIDEIIKRDVSFDKIDKLLDETSIKIENGSNIKELLLLFYKFNELLYQMSGLKHTLKLINDINIFTRKFRVNSLTDTNRLKKALEEHKLLIKLLKEKDEKRAKEINKNHLNTSMQITLEKQEEKK